MCVRVHVHQCAFVHVGDHHQLRFLHREGHLSSIKNAGSLDKYSNHPSHPAAARGQSRPGESFLSARGLPCAYL